MKTNRLFFVIAVYSFSFCVMGQMKIQNDGQISIGVGRRFCEREFAPSGDKPPPAGAACPIELLNAHIQKAADFVFRYKVGRFHLRLPGQRIRGPPPPICFPQKTNRR